MLYSVFFCHSMNWTKKMGGSIWPPPPGKPRIGQHPGKGGVKIKQTQKFQNSLFDTKRKVETNWSI